MVKHMMMAHTRAYKRLKKMLPDVEIGFTHDPIRFRCYHKWHPLWSPLEKCLAYYLTEITHSAYMRLLLTGKFALKVPFLANEVFEISEFAEKAARPLDFIGVQYYTDPLLRLPDGSVSRLRERLTGYGYRPYPQGLVSVLEEFSALEIPIDMTEIGIDSKIDQDAELDSERIAYFEKIFQAAQFGLDQGIDLRSIYWWTHARSWEWHEQMEMDFGWYDSAGKPRPCADWLKAKAGRG
jgi:beta-glucosidase/6-phospho-beta-glucosidase/beta-galactosidase